MIVRSMLVVVAVTSGLLPGCASRPLHPVGRYQIAKFETCYYVLPPGFSGPRVAPPAEYSGQLTASHPRRPSGECTAPGKGFRLAPTQRGGIGFAVTLQLRSSSGDGAYARNQISEIRMAVERMAESNCLRAADVRPLIRELIENLPLHFEEVLTTHYGYLRGGGYVNLSRGLRLKVQRAVFSGDNGKAKPLDNYLGTITKVYEVFEDKRGDLALRLMSIESDLPAGPGREVQLRLSTSFHKFAHVFCGAIQAAMRSLEGHFESNLARSRRVNFHWNGWAMDSQ